MLPRDFREFSGLCAWRKPRQPELCAGGEGRGAVEEGPGEVEEGQGAVEEGRPGAGGKGRR